MKEWGWYVDSEKQSSNKKQQIKAALVGRKKKGQQTKGRIGIVKYFRKISSEQSTENY